MSLQNIDLSFKHLPDFPGGGFKCLSRLRIWHANPLDFISGWKEQSFSLGVGSDFATFQLVAGDSLQHSEERSDGPLQSPSTKRHTITQPSG